MLCPRRAPCEMGSFSTRSPSQGKRYPERPNPDLFPSVASLFVDFGQVRTAFLTPNTQTHTHTNHQEKKEWKGQVTGWPLIHDSALKTRLSNQIVRLEGPTGPQSCPRPPGVTEQLRGVNVHFSQLSKTCDGGKGKQRRTEVIWPTNIDSLKLINGSSKKLRDGWNYQTSKSPDGLWWYCCRRTFQSAMCDLSVFEFIISMPTSAGWEYMIYIVKIGHGSNWYGNTHIKFPYED